MLIDANNPCNLLKTRERIWTSDPLVTTVANAVNDRLRGSRNFTQVRL